MKKIVRKTFHICFSSFIYKYLLSRSSFSSFHSHFHPQLYSNDTTESIEKNRMVDVWPNRRRGKVIIIIIYKSLKYIHKKFSILFSWTSLSSSSTFILLFFNSLPQTRHSFDFQLLHLVYSCFFQFGQLFLFIPPATAINTPKSWKHTVWLQKALIKTKWGRANLGCNHTAESDVEEHSETENNNECVAAYRTGELKW